MSTKAIIEDAKLDPELWSLSRTEPMTFSYMSDTSLTIVCMGDPGDKYRWTAYAGGEEIGDYEEPQDAAEGLLNPPAHGL
jgi:hypothetical protein